jgi:hypothetical protein
VELKAIMWNNNEGTLLVDYIRRRSNLLPRVTWSVVPCLSLQVTASATGDAAPAGAPAVVTDVSVGQPNLSSGPPSSEPAVQEAGGRALVGDDTTSVSSVTRGYCGSIPICAKRTRWIRPAPHMRSI